MNLIIDVMSLLEWKEISFNLVKLILIFTIKTDTNLVSAFYAVLFHTYTVKYGGMLL